MGTGHIFSHKFAVEPKEKKKKKIKMKSRKMRKQEDKTWTGKNGGCLGCRCNISVNIPDDKERRRPEKVLKQIPGKRKEKKENEIYLRREIGGQHTALIVQPTGLQLLQQF